MQSGFAFPSIKTTTKSQKPHPYIIIIRTDIYQHLFAKDYCVPANKPYMIVQLEIEKKYGTGKARPHNGRALTIKTFHKTVPLHPGTSVKPPPIGTYL